MKMQYVVLALSVALSGCAHYYGYTPDVFGEPAVLDDTFRNYVESTASPRCQDEIFFTVDMEISPSRPAGWPCPEGLTCLGKTMTWVNSEGVVRKVQVWVDSDLPEEVRESVIVHEAIHTILLCETGDLDSEHEHRLFVDAGAGL